mmetsp:Transcript_14999/g.41536  ORF Transcript_14999/g.41536 Transcript_14999/m.41536 type:complete len:324 (-) Transcript_14999:57-1028(-)
MSHPPTDIPWKESRFHNQNQAKEATEKAASKTDGHGTAGDNDNDKDKNEGKIAATKDVPNMTGGVEEEEYPDENDDMFAMFADPDPYQTFEFDFPRNAGTGSAAGKSDAEKDSSNGNDGMIHIALHGQKQENGQTLHSTGLTLWRAAELLCDYMVQEQATFIHNKSCLELGAGLGLVGILAHHLNAKRVIMTDGDTATLENLRENVANNVSAGNSDDDDDNKTSQLILPCPQLIWGHELDAFARHYDAPFDTILAADIIYVTEIIVPLWKTVDAFLSEDGVFLLAYARRNVPIDLVLDEAKKQGFEWSCPSSAEGVFVFTRSK